MPYSSRIEFPYITPRILGRRFGNIFRESSTWAEFGSFAGCMLYVVWAFYSECFLTRDLGTWPSMTLIASIIDPAPWIAVSFACAVYQLFAILLNGRIFRLSASVLLLFWYSFLVHMNMPINGGSPMLAFPFALGLLSFLSIIRHARDWNVDIRLA